MKSGISCPECGAWTVVLESRTLANNTIRRRRECANEHRFVTHEKFVGFIKPQGKRNQMERMESISKSDRASPEATQPKATKAK